MHAICSIDAPNAFGASFRHIAVLVVGILLWLLLMRKMEHESNNLEKTMDYFTLDTLKETLPAELKKVRAKV